MSVCVALVLLTLAAGARAGSIADFNIRLAEPLLRTAPTGAAEDAALAAALAQDTTDPETMPALRGFAAAYPRSGWRMAVLANLALNDIHRGYFTRATHSLEQAWDIARLVRDMPERRLADRVAGELLRLHGRLGHAQRLAALLQQTQGRALAGPATELRDEARDALAMMRRHPDTAFRCGPAALQTAMLAAGASRPSVAYLDHAAAGPTGMSLAELARLAGGGYRVIARAAGAAVPLPAVVHWKSGHYAAVLRARDGGYEIADPVFAAAPFWVSRAAMDAESSGFFLAPVAQLQAGWRLADAAQAATIRGAGYVGNSFLQTALTILDRLAQNNCGCNHGMTGYGFMEMAVSLNLSDTPVGYVPPKGPPVRVTITYNQRDQANEPASFAFSNVSPLWSMNWLSYMQDDPAHPGASVSRFAAGGGAVDYAGYSAASGDFAPDPYDASVLSYAASPAAYQRLLPDGSLEIYAASNGAAAYPRRIFLSQIVDPAGNAVSLAYDNQMRLLSLTDATGRKTLFGYANANPLLITSITDPFGRSAQLTYDSAGRLSQITDVLGIASVYGYNANSLVDALTTPYGTTSFTFGAMTSDERYVQATDPLGHTERLEFTEGAPGIADTENAVPSGLVYPVNAYLSDRDTFYWDKHAYAVGAGNYLMARMRHWAHLQVNGNQLSTLSNTLESERPALEGRVWYSYPGQSSQIQGFESGTLNKPIAIARLLDNGATQLTQIQYNALGNPSSFVDPLKRSTTLAYAANNVDVMTVQQATAAGPVTIGAYTYNSQHLPLTYTDAAGQTTHYAYNAAGQLTLVTNALGQTTQFNYNPLGYLTSVVNANGKTAVGFTYDGFGRVATRTDSEGWTIAYTYDPFDRVTQETYPDGTTRVYGYTNLDLVSVTDRQGRVTMLSYDAVRNLTQVSDPLKQITQFGYYENQTPETLTDANGNVTSWAIDVQSRVTGKTYADGTFTASLYEASTSRLHALTDALGQTKSYTYLADDRLAGIGYANTINPTPAVAFSYDPYFSRVTAMADGTGTTNYGYAAVGSPGALHLASESPPFANSAILYQYDALGRLITRSVGGDTESLGYDMIGRVVAHDDDLGNFQLSYLGQTTQLTQRQSGLVGTRWLYHDNLGDRRLRAIINSPVASRYRYTTTPENDITTIDEDVGYQLWHYSYDMADRLTGAGSSLGATYQYGHDAAGNLGPIQTPSGTIAVQSNALNQITQFGATPFTYDKNGNLLADYARTYQWDAENRLVGIGYPGSSGAMTAMAYDGLGRRVMITDTSGGVTSRNNFSWCGQVICQETNASATPVKRYLAEGEQSLLAATGLYYGADQLGSVRDSINAKNGLRAYHYDYAPFGAVSGSVGLQSGQTDFRYSHLYMHQLSNLMLATYRAYDPITGRWLSRDPSGESSGANLYNYVVNNPVSSFDFLGLDAILFWGGSPSDLQSYASYQNVINSPEYKLAQEQYQIHQLTKVLNFDLTVLVAFIPGAGEAKLCLSGASLLDAGSLGLAKMAGQLGEAIGGQSAGQSTEALSGATIDTLVEELIGDQNNDQPRKFTPVPYNQ